MDGVFLESHICNPYNPPFSRCCLFIIETQPIDSIISKIQSHTLDQLIIPTMSPSAVLPETTGGLANAAMKHTIERTAPSLKSIANGTYPALAELDAGKLTFTRNLNPKVVPEPDSPEVWSQSVYDFAGILVHMR